MRRVLDVSDAYLEGTLPASIAALTKLRYLNVDDNMLIGTIPSGLQSITTLEKLSVARNRFEGPLSSWLSPSWSSLKYDGCPLPQCRAVR